VTRNRRGAICLEIYGRHTWYWGLEVFNSSPERRATRPGAAADPRGVGVLGRSGLGVRLINMVIHDVGTALFESQPSGLEIYGLLAYNNGWQGPDRSHGPGLYMRNRAGFPAKTIEDSVVFQNFRQGLQGYGTGPNVFSRFRVEGNAFFNNGIGRDGFHRNLMFGNRSPGHDDNVFRHNVTYYPPGFSSSAGSNRLGAAPETCARLTLENNIFAHGPGRGAVEVEGCSELRLRGNLFHGRAEIDGAEMAASYPENKYPEQPTGQLARLRVNRYEPRRALLTVLNWSEAPDVEVELCGWSPPEGAMISVRSAQDPFGRELRSWFHGEPLELPMTGWGAARPIGLETQPLPPTYPRFGVFLLSWDAPSGGLSE